MRAQARARTARVVGKLLAAGEGVPTPRKPLSIVTGTDLEAAMVRDCGSEWAGGYEPSRVHALPRPRRRSDLCWPAPKSHNPR